MHEKQPLYTERAAFGVQFFRSFGFFVFPSFSGGFSGPFFMRGSSLFFKQKGHSEGFSPIFHFRQKVEQSALSNILNSIIFSSNEKSTGLSHGIRTNCFVCS